MASEKQSQVKKEKTERQKLCIFEDLVDSYMLSFLSDIFEEADCNSKLLAWSAAIALCLSVSCHLGALNAEFFQLPVSSECVISCADNEVTKLYTRLLLPDLMEN